MIIETSGKVGFDNMKNILDTLYLHLNNTYQSKNWTIFKAGSRTSILITSSKITLKWMSIRMVNVISSVLANHNYEEKFIKP